MKDNSCTSLYGDTPPCSLEDIEKSIRKRFKHDLEGRFEKAVVQYSLIEEGDHIAVCILCLHCTSCIGIESVFCSGKRIVCRE